MLHFILYHPSCVAFLLYCTLCYFSSLLSTIVHINYPSDAHHSALCPIIHHLWYLSALSLIVLHIYYFLFTCLHIQVVCFLLLTIFLLHCSSIFHHFHLYSYVNFLFYRLMFQLSTITYDFNYVIIILIKHSYSRYCRA